MKILVTGATGFVGRYVVKALLKKNIEVVATSRDPEKVKNVPWFSEVEYIACDLSEAGRNFFSYFNGPDCMIHLAWDGLSHYNSNDHFEKGVALHYRFIKNMLANGLGHLIVAGTCLEYGLQNGCLSEEMDTRPVVSYGLAKDTLRKYLEHQIKNRPVTFQWIRLFYMYGAGQSENALLPQLDQAIENGSEFFNMSGGEQLRDYLSVETIAAHIVAIALQKKITGLINCCSGVPVSVRQLVEKRIWETGSSIKLNLGHYPYPDYEPMAFWGDIRKLKMIIESQ